MFVLQVEIGSAYMVERKIVMESSPERMCQKDHKMELTQRCRSFCWLAKTLWTRA
jgi:hypothetical protein